MAPLYAFFLLSLSFYVDSVYYPCIEDEGMWWDAGAGDEGEVFVRVYGDFVKLGCRRTRCIGPLVTRV